MIVDNVTDVPIFMDLESCGTNETNCTNNDNNSNPLKGMIKAFDQFKEHTCDEYIYLCGDSALYSPESIQKIEDSGIKFAAKSQNEHSVDSMKEKEMSKLQKLIGEYEKNLFASRQDAKKRISKIPQEVSLLQGDWQFNNSTKNPKGNLLDQN